MGRKLDALLGRGFKEPKFTALLNLATARLTVLRNQRHVKFTQATSDVVKLVENGHHERALIRVEQLIKEQNMVDVFDMVEGFLNLIAESVNLIKQERECPEELKEAVSSLIFAASRVGDFPELYEIRVVLTSRYGKEFAARSVELRNNCSVNTRMIQKLSTRPPGLQNKMKVLKEIADEKSIVLKLEGASSSSSSSLFEEKSDTSVKPSTYKKDDEMQTTTGTVGDEERFSDSINGRKKYKDVAAAAQDAFKSAAHAAEAARAVVEFSRSQSHDPDDHDSPATRTRKQSDDDSKKEKPESSKKVHVTEKEKDEAEPARSLSGSSTDSAEDNMKVFISPSFNYEDPVKLLEKDTIIYESDDETHRSVFAMRTNNAEPFEKGPISVRSKQVRGY